MTAGQSKNLEDLYRERTTSSSRVEYRVLITLLAIAVIVRIFWLWWRPYPITGDPREYLAYARNLVFYHTYTLDIVENSTYDLTSRAPLYSALIAGLWWGNSAPLALVKGLQVILGSATAGLVYLLARDRFDRRVATVASLGMAVAPMSSYFAGAILADTLYVFLLTFGFFLWGRRRWVVAGIIFGLTALTKPTILPFLVMLPFLGLLPAWRPQWRRYLLIMGVALVVISPWIVRNSLINKRFTLVGAQGYGEMILFGAIETPYDDPWTTLQNHPLVKVDEGSTDLLEMDRARARRGLNYIKDHPWDWLVVRLTNQFPRLLIDDGSYVLDFYHVQFGDAFRNPRPFVMLLVANKFLFVAGNILLFLFAAFGLIVERARFVELSHITLFPIVLLLNYLPLWTETRHSLPIVPSVSIFAAVGLLRCLDSFRARRRASDGNKAAVGVTDFKTSANR